jgi:hypothetical protein
MEPIDVLDAFHSDVNQSPAFKHASETFDIATYFGQREGI